MSDCTRLYNSFETLTHNTVTGGAGGTPTPVSQPRAVDPDLARWKLLGQQRSTPYGAVRRLCDEVMMHHAALGNAVCWELLVGKTRAQKVFVVRADCMKRIRETFGWSYPRIGRMFKRDHTSVMNAINPKTQTRKLASRAREELAHEASEVQAQLNKGAQA